MIELGGVVHPFDLAARSRGSDFPRRISPTSGSTAQRRLPDPNGADVEVALDYQVIGAMVAAMAPKGAPHDRQLQRAQQRARVHRCGGDRGERRDPPSGGGLDQLGSLRRTTGRTRACAGSTAAFATGALHGVTFSAAAGDAGSTNDEVDGYQHPEFPASSPHAWACGGTTLLAARGRIRTETVWNELARGAGAAGSGVSTVFPVPAYQAELGIRPRSADGGAFGRGLPDGSGNADPLTGWNVVALRRLRSTGGTSAVAPMYTALWTLVSAQLEHRIGLPHPALYARRGRGFNDVTAGDTGGPYRAGRGWDLASGWGSPDGRQIARDLGVRLPAQEVRRPRSIGEREIA